jgi:hypothetical protein
MPVIVLAKTTVTPRYRTISSTARSAIKQCPHGSVTCIQGLRRRRLAQQMLRRLDARHLVLPGELLLHIRHPFDSLSCIVRSSPGSVCLRPTATTAYISGTDTD